MDTPALPLSLVEDSRPNVWRGTPQEMELVRRRARGRPSGPSSDQQGKNKDVAWPFSQHGPGWLSWSASAAVLEGGAAALQRADTHRSDRGPRAVSSPATIPVSKEEIKTRRDFFTIMVPVERRAADICFSHSSHDKSCRMSEFPGPDSVGNNILYLIQPYHGLEGQVSTVKF